MDRIILCKAISSKQEDRDKITNFVNNRILRKAIDLPSKQEDYNKITKLMKFIRLSYPSLVLEEEGCYCTIYSDYLDDIDNFISTLNKLINYPDNEKILLTLK